MNSNNGDHDNGGCDYQDDWGGWGNQDHTHCNGDFGDQDDKGWWDKVNDWDTCGDQDGKGDYDEPAISRITGLTGMTGLTELTRTRLIPCQTPQSQNKVSHTSLVGQKKTFDTWNA